MGMRAQYQVIVHELAFSGVPGVPCLIAVWRGPAARRKAIEHAKAEAADRVSVTAVEVVQVGGAADGVVIERVSNPNAYMPAGHPYCAGIYVDRKGDIIGVYAVSRDSRERHTSPPNYTFEVLTPGVVVPDPTASRESVLASLGVPAAACG